MFDQPAVRIGGKRGRWFGGASAAVAIHVSVMGSAVLIAQTAPTRAPKFMKSALTYIALSAPVSMPDPTPIVFPDGAAMAELMPGLEEQDPAYVPTPDPLNLPKPEPTYTPKPEPLPVPKVDPAASLLKDAFASTPVQMPKPAPQLAVGAFAAGDTPGRTQNTNKQIDRAGFDAPIAQAVPITKATATAGTFDASSNTARPGTDRPVGTLTADAGFGRATTAAAVRQPASAVVETEFGGAPGPKGPGLRTVTSAAVVPVAGFDATTTTPAAKPATPAERIEIPMEVISKPNPIYTAEARDLKLEGEVALEVEFCASGEVRVLRVVKGLGHGLDEAAVHSAEKIRFKPAQSHGHAVDVTTTVYITFRLS